MARKAQPDAAASAGSSVRDTFLGSKVPDFVSKAAQIAVDYTPQPLQNLAAKWLPSEATVQAAVSKLPCAAAVLKDPKAAARSGVECVAKRVFEWVIAGISMLLAVLFIAIQDTVGFLSTAMEKIQQLTAFVQSFRPELSTPTHTPTHAQTHTANGDRQADTPDTASVSVTTSPDTLHLSGDNESETDRQPVVVGEQAAANGNGSAEGGEKSKKKSKGKKK